MGWGHLASRAPSSERVSRVPIVTPTEMARLTLTLVTPLSGDCVPRGGVCSEGIPSSPQVTAPTWGSWRSCHLGVGGDHSELDGNRQNPLGHQQHARSMSPRGSPAWAGGAEPLRTVAGEETSGCSPAA